MEAQGGGSSTPSYSNVFSNRGRARNKNQTPQPLEVKTKNTETHKAEGNKTHAEQGTHEEDRQEEIAEDRGQRTENRNKMGPYKPKTITKPRVILNDPALQEHRITWQTMPLYINLWESGRQRKRCTPR